MKTILVVDWENFKRKAEAVFKDSKKSKPQWHTYNFTKLFDLVLKGMAISDVVFYAARIKEHPETKEKSKQLIEEQRLVKTHLEKQGFKVVLSGRVRGQKELGIDGKSVLIFKEKGVDVQIAVDIVSWACDKSIKTIILGSSDSDLQPAIREIKRRNVECIYLGFELQPNKGISYNSNRTILIRNAEILECEK